MKQSRFNIRTFLLFILHLFIFLFSSLASINIPIIRLIIPKLNESNLGIRHNPKLLKALLKAVWRDINIIILAFVLYHHNALVLPPQHKGVPEMCARSHGLLELIHWIYL